MMYSCDDSNDLLHAFFTLTCPSAYYMLYRNMSIYTQYTLGAIYWYGKIQYCPSSKSHMTKSPRPSLSIIAYCKKSSTGGGNGLGTRLWIYLFIIAIKSSSSIHMFAEVWGCRRGILSSTMYIHISSVAWGCWRCRRPYPSWPWWYQNTERNQGRLARGWSAERY